VGRCHATCQELKSQHNFDANPMKAHFQLSYARSNGRFLTPNQRNRISSFQSTRTTNHNHNHNYNHYGSESERLDEYVNAIPFTSSSPQTRLLTYSSSTSKYATLTRRSPQRPRKSFSQQTQICTCAIMPWSLNVHVLYFK